MVYEGVSKTQDVGSNPTSPTINFSAECDSHDLLLDAQSLGLTCKKLLKREREAFTYPANKLKRKGNTMSF